MTIELLEQDAAPPAVIDVRSLGKRFEGKGGGYEALHEIDLEVRAGEFVCLLGPSGCGKTTLLNILAGFELPSSGEARVLGEDSDRPSHKRGVVFQTENAIFDWLTVEENVAFGPRMRGLPAAEVKAEVMRCLELVGLTNHGPKFPRQISGGMKQRVQIARVLANEPEVLFMDEPFAALDAHTRLKMQEELTRIWQQTHTTIVFVTHDIGEALRLADRIVVLSKGPRSTIRRIEDIKLPRPRTITPQFSALFDSLGALFSNEAHDG